MKGDIQRRISIAILALTVLWTLPAQADPPARQVTSRSPHEVADAVIKAMVVYHFAKFIEWPEAVFADKQSPIKICFYGEKPSEIRQASAAINGKIAQGREIRVKRMATLPELSDCQLIFIPENEKRWMQEILRIAGAASALTVSDMENSIDAGGGAGLLTIDNQIRFEFNLEATQASRLKISSQLLKLARMVKGQAVRSE